MTDSGILNINKPAGFTSSGVVRLVKRLSGQKHVGHGGTLDPRATGVLLILVGQATRVAQYLLEAPKTYRADIQLGITTDSYDAAGKILTTTDPSHITKEAVEKALGSFRGTVSQEPPMYSAIHYQGKRLYDLARQGVVVPREKRQRTVYRLDMTGWQPPLFTIELECEEGFYVRSLAHDIGEFLGCGAHLRNLCRLKQGDFSIRDALAIDQVEEACKYGLIRLQIYPPDAVLLRKRAVILGDAEQVSLAQGKSLKLERCSGTLQKLAVAQPPVPTTEQDEVCRAYSTAGAFLGVGRWKAEHKVLYPEKVFLKAS